MRISVVIPTYNRPNLLRLTINSVLAQTRQADEVIVIDDGSTEDIKSVVTSFGDRVRYHHQKNLGQGAARAKGTFLCTGEAICYLDADDLLLPQALETLERCLNDSPNAVAVYGDCVLMSTGGEDLKPCPLSEFQSKGDFWLELIQGNRIRTPGCVLIRRESLLKVGNWDSDRRIYRIEDWELWLRLAQHGSFRHVSSNVLRYRTANPDGLPIKAHELVAIYYMYQKQVHSNAKDQKKKHIASCFRHNALVMRDEFARQILNNFSEQASYKTRLLSAWRIYPKSIWSTIPILRRLYWYHNGKLYKTQANLQAKSL